MGQRILRRATATLGALIVATVGGVGIWFNLDFNRVYFPIASVVSAIADPIVIACFLALIYFAAVCGSGRWAPWRQQG